ncbi:hypothetical protein B0T20DRAFT_418295, partial [Sordaria brevicollis]
MRPSSLLHFVASALLHFGVGLALPRPPVTSSLALSLREPIHKQSYPAKLALVKREEDDLVNNESAAPSSSPDEPWLSATEHVSTDHISRSETDEDAEHHGNGLHESVSTETTTHVARDSTDGEGKDDIVVRGIERRGSSAKTIGILCGYIVAGIVGLILLVFVVERSTRKCRA